MMQRRPLSLLGILLICMVSLAGAAAPAGEPALAIRSYSLNKFVPVLDGQWQGIRLATDGNCYFGSSTHAHNHGAAFFRYDPRTQQLTMLCEDLSRLCGEEPPRNTPQGKLHSDVVEHDGWLYFATHLGFYTPEGKANYAGAHVIGYELSSGKFRDFGVVRPGYSCYSGINVDRRRGCLYVFLTTFNPGGEVAPASHLYRVDIATGQKQDLGALMPGGPHHCFWFFIDRSGDCWFTLGNDKGSLHRLRAADDRLDRWENVLPEPEAGPDRWWHWAQPLPNQNRFVFTLFNGSSLWTFDPDRFAADPASAFSRVAEIGYSYLGLAVTDDRVYYVQRANRQKGHQDVNDHHLLSVSLAASGPGKIVDHGLIVDQDGRRAYRIPALAADRQGHVFLVGDWYVLPTERGSYRHQKGDRYEYLNRGEFFAVADLRGAEPSRGGTADSSAKQLYGEPKVMKFKDGKSAAFSMQFDDSMETQADFAIPEMNKRGLVGTFFINPATDRYARRRETWEVVCPERGHELANHTLRHKGAADYEEADREIGGSARHIWKLYPEKSKLRPFLSGGGTTWSISQAQRSELMDKYFLFRAPGRASISDDSANKQPIVQARQALEKGQWGLVGFHGIGGQWICTSEKAFVEMLDFLVENKGRMWTGTTGDVYRYVQERDAVKAVSLTDAEGGSFRISIECDPSKVTTYGRPFTELYDLPLTVRVPVPESWSRFTIKQRGREDSGKVLEMDGRPVAQLDVLPNAEAAVVTMAH